MTNIQIATFYKFTPLSGLDDLRADLLDFCNKNNILGTILIGNEGINGTVAAQHDSIMSLLDFLKKIDGLSDLKPKFSESLDIPFRRMKVRIKKEIVTLGVDGIDPNHKTGAHIPAEDWNKIILDPDVVLIDTRNDYETHIGTFKGAVVPKLESFRDFPQFVKDNLDPTKHKKIAMFCTGGIRCEKASAYMLAEGFEDVVQLDGGILKYLEDTPKENSFWQGDCYVFDGRMAVTADLKPGPYTICPTCRWPVAEDEKTHPDYEDGVTCKQCKHTAPIETVKASRERKKQMALAAKRGEDYFK